MPSYCEYYQLATILFWRQIVWQLDALRMVLCLREILSPYPFICTQSFLKVSLLCRFFRSPSTITAEWLSRMRPVLILAQKCKPNLGCSSVKYLTSLTILAKFGKEFVVLPSKFQCHVIKCFSGEYISPQMAKDAFFFQKKCTQGHKSFR